MTAADHTLPDLDALPPSELKALIFSQQEKIFSQHKQLLSKDEQLASRDTEIEHLKLLIAKLRRMQFGRRSEKLKRQIEQLELQLDELQTAQAETPLASPMPEATAAHGGERKAHTAAAAGPSTATSAADPVQGIRLSGLR